MRKIKNLEQIKLTGVYYYSGFSTPEKIASGVYGFLNDLKEGETTISSNYLGDLSQEVFEEALQCLKEKDYDYLKEFLNNYNIFYNPSLNEFSEMNTCSYGLGETTYLESFI